MHYLLQYWKLGETVFLTGWSECATLPWQPEAPQGDVQRAACPPPGGQYAVCGALRGPGESHWPMCTVVYEREREREGERERERVGCGRIVQEGGSVCVSLLCVHVTTGEGDPKGVRICEGESAVCELPCAYPWPWRLPNDAGTLVPSCTRMISPHAIT